MPLLPIVATCLLAADLPVRSQPFVAAGGNFYRLPGLTVTRSGAILAFAGKRKGNVGDWGHDSDVVLRRSLDGGLTWLPEQTIASRPETDIHSGPVVSDQRTGQLLKFCRFWPASDEPQKLVGRTPYAQMAKLGWIDHVMHSADDGVTWSAPEPLVMPYPETATSAATGNGVHGLQLPDGRLLIQCGYVVDATRHIGILWSDDHGATWQLGATAVVGEALREFGMALLPDGRVYVNTRSHLDDHRRQVALSEDRGLTFTDFDADPGLLEPHCHAAVVRHPTAGLLFSNPTQGRRKLVVRLSPDNGATWPYAKLLDEGPAAYSDLSITPAGEVVCLWESGVKDAYEALSFARFSPAWLQMADSRP